MFWNHTDVVVYWNKGSGSGFHHILTSLYMFPAICGNQVIKTKTPRSNRRTTNTGTSETEVKLKPPDARCWLVGVEVTSPAPFPVGYMLKQCGKVA